MKCKLLLVLTVLFWGTFCRAEVEGGKTDSNNSEALAIAEKASVYIDEASFSVETDYNGLLIKYYQQYDPATGTVCRKSMLDGRVMDIFNRDGFFYVSGDTLLRRTDDAKLTIINKFLYSGVREAELKETEYNGIPCWEVTLIYPYLSIKLTIDKESYFPYSGIYYDTDGIEKDYPRFKFKNVTLNPEFAADFFDTPKGLKEVEVNSGREAQDFLLAQNLAVHTAADSGNNIGLWKTIFLIVIGVLAVALIVIIGVRLKRKNSQLQP